MSAEMTDQITRLLAEGYVFHAAPLDSGWFEVLVTGPDGSTIRNEADDPRLALCVALSQISA